MSRVITKIPQISASTADSHRPKKLDRIMTYTDELIEWEKTRKIMFTSVSPRVRASLEKKIPTNQSRNPVNQSTPRRRRRRLRLVALAPRHMPNSAARGTPEREATRRAGGTRGKKGDTEEGAGTAGVRPRRLPGDHRRRGGRGDRAGQGRRRAEPSERQALQIWGPGLGLARFL